MIEDKIEKLDYFLEFLENNQGYHAHLDEKLKSICMNREYLKNQIINNPSHSLLDESMLVKLVNLINQFQSYLENEEFMKSRSFLQTVTSELVMSIPSRPDPMVLFSDTNANNYLDFTLENGRTSFVEVSFLEEKKIALCSSLNHEIGHCLQKEYMLQDGNPQDFLDRIKSPLLKQLKKLKSKESMEYIAWWFMNWMAEFTADAFSVTTLGIGGLIGYIKESQHLGIPMFLGSNTHPPLNLRIQFMKERLMKVVRGQGIENSSLSIIEDWAPTGRNQMPTETFVRSALNDPQFNSEGIQEFIEHGGTTSIPNKLAFDRQILNAIYSVIDRILQWGGVEPDFQSILNAKRELLNNTIPDVENHIIFAALIDISERNAEPENLILSRTGEN
ncbi:MAG: hypothetical protein ACTSWA_02700 [Candidatus Thorarchaeota archaeon]